MRELTIQTLLNAWEENQASDNPAQSWVEMLEAQDVGLHHLTDAARQLAVDLPDKTLALGVIREEVANLLTPLPED